MVFLSLLSMLEKNGEHQVPALKTIAVQCESGAQHRIAVEDGNVRREPTQLLYDKKCFHSYLKVCFFSPLKEQKIF